MQISANPVKAIVKSQFLRWRLRQVSRLYGVSGFGLLEVEMDPVAWLLGEIRWKRLRCISRDGNDLDFREGDSTLLPTELMLPEPLEGKELRLWVWPYSKEMLLGRIWGYGFEVPFGTDSAICVYYWRGDGSRWLMEKDHFPPVIRLGASKHWKNGLEEIQQACPDADISKAIPWLMEAEPLELWREGVRYCLAKGVAMEELPRFHRYDHGEWMPRLLAIIRRIS